MAEQWDLLVYSPESGAADSDAICKRRLRHLLRQRPATEAACAECGQCDVAEDVEKVQHCGRKALSLTWVGPAQPPSRIEASGATRLDGVRRSA